MPDEEAHRADGIILNAASSGRWANLVAAIQRLASTSSLDEVLHTLRTTARGIVEADGIAVVLKDGDFCYYVAEDARSPLWAGQRFPAHTCISGHAMRSNETIIIPDIEFDPRVPIEAYRPTFVRSLIMVPIGRPDAIAAVGAYWSDTGERPGSEIAMLEVLARSAATALENTRLIGQLQDMNSSLETLVAERTAELERTHETLRQAQKLEIIGKLTGNVAHDFNNLLTPIMSSVDMILRRGPLDERSQNLLTRAMDATERAKLLVQRLLSFARRQPLQPVAVDLRQLIENTMGLLVSTVGPRITIHSDIPADLPLVRADADQLDLAILNLVVNARDAMPEGGRMVITAAASGDEFVALSIADTGEGMNAETIAHATEPFFSTKSIGQGTGLGLSMVDGLVAQLGGRLSIESQPNLGTTIHLFLPRWLLSPSLHYGETSDDAVEEDDRSVVLLIDDDDLARAATADMLVDLGFEVIEAESASQGLAVICSAPNLSAVVTDHLMPGMTGADLARKLKDDRPELPVLIISGYQKIESVAPDMPRLAKPFRHSQLGASIAAILGDGSLH